MAGNLATTPTYSLQPSAKQVALPSNYITNFDFLNQYLPDVYEEEFERYGNRSVSSFLRLVGAELPFTSDMIKWTEQGRLHIKYVNVGTGALVNDPTAEFTVNDALTGNMAIRKGQTLIISQNDGSGSNKAIVTAANADLGKFTVAFYEATGLVTAGTGAGNADVTVMIYGSEFQKGTVAMEGSLEAQTEIYENTPIIIKDHFEVAGSDMAQIGWVEVTDELGDSGFLWYLKSAGETRLRFEDYMETSVVEAVPAEAGSGVIAITGAGVVGNKGSDGFFYSVENRGNVWSGGNPDTLSEFDAIVSRLDKQGAIEENVWFLNRDFSFDIDDMLAAQNSYGVGGTSWGLFDNDKQMALNLGFDGFRRGYDFYKTDWKYLNESTMRGDLPSDNVNGVMVPAGTKTVYDQVLGKNAKRPFLHVRYRASETENRRMKTWSEGGAGGHTNTGTDKMDIHFLTERVLCTLGANNFFIAKD